MTPAWAKGALGDWLGVGRLGWIVVRKPESEGRDLPPGTHPDQTMYRESKTVQNERNGGGMTCAKHAHVGMGGRAQGSAAVPNFSFSVSNEIYMGSRLTLGFHYNFHSDQPI